MIYCNDGDLLIRNMEEADAQIFYDEYLAQGWHPDLSVYRTRLKDQEEGRCVALTAAWIVALELFAKLLFSRAVRKVTVQGG